MHARRTAVPLAVAALVALGGCSDGPASPDPVAPAVSRAGQPIPTRAQERPGTWVERTDAQLWAAIEAAGGSAAVGLKAPGGVRGVWRGRVLVGRSEWSQGRAAVAAQPGVTLVRATTSSPPWR
jgi:hypothetical protein